MFFKPIIGNQKQSSLLKEFLLVKCLTCTFSVNFTNMFPDSKWTRSLVSLLSELPLYTHAHKQAPDVVPQVLGVPGSITCTSPQDLLYHSCIRTQDLIHKAYAGGPWARKASVAPTTFIVEWLSWQKWRDNCVLQVAIFQLDCSQGVLLKGASIYMNFSTQA